MKEIKMDFETYERDLQSARQSARRKGYDCGLDAVIEWGKSQVELKYYIEDMETWRQSKWIEIAKLMSKMEKNND